MEKPWEISGTWYADEAALIRGLRRGDPMACTCLMKQFAPRLSRLALRLMGDADAAEDVIQEGFIRACDHIATFEGRSSIGSWLYRIIANAAHMRLRRPAQRTASLDQLAETGGEPALLNPAPDPISLMVDAEFGESIRNLLPRLPPALRVTFVLRDLDGLSTRETAVALGITESAVKVRLHRAHLALRPLLMQGVG